MMPTEPGVSIRDKLIAIIIASCSLALLLVSVAFTHRTPARWGLYQPLRQLLRFIAIASSPALLPAIVLWAILQRVITRPIHLLIGAMSKVWRDKNFSVRVPPVAKAELGALIN